MLNPIRVFTLSSLMLLALALSPEPATQAVAGPFAQFPEAQVSVALEESLTPPAAFETSAGLTLNP